MGHDWIEIRPLGAGGQGTVTLVRRQGQKDLIDHMIENVQRLLKSSNTEIKRDARENLEMNLQAFIQSGPSLAVKKQLIKPDEESISRLMREAEVYESISDPHLLRILDKSLEHHSIVTEHQPNGTLETRLVDYQGDV